MSAAVVVESVQDVASASPVRADGRVARAVLGGHDAERERELDSVVATIEGAARGLGLFLVLALFGITFVVATLTGVLG